MCQIPSEVAQAYLDHWKAEEYPAMYSLLTRLSQDAISEDRFHCPLPGSGE